jgi:hypothetical protein
MMFALGQPPRIGDPCVIEAALKLASLGLHVFPTLPEEPKVFLPSHGSKVGSIDPDVIAAWWRACPAANLAVATGDPSGAFVLDVDIDAPLDGMATLRALEAEHGPLPHTWSTLTPSGGKHLWFRQPERPLGNRVSFLPGLDMRTTWGAATVPPSRRPDGLAYSWIVAPWDNPLADCPAWLFSLIAPPPAVDPPHPPLPRLTMEEAVKYTGGVINTACGAVLNAALADRTRQLLQAAAVLGELVACGLCPARLALSQLHATAHACGLARDDGPDAVAATIRAGWLAGAANPRETTL